MKTYFDKGCQAISQRATWEQKQRLYYQMRHDGLPRKNKPWPNAASLHFPLIDMNIRKGKPFWESQATAAGKLAEFISLKEQQKTTTVAAAEFHDFELKQNTNFETELIRAIDTMLLRGRGILKVTVDPLDDYRIVCDAIDTPFIVMADLADDFPDADWWIEIQHLSVAGYRRNRRYIQDDGLINAIRGSVDMDLSSAVFEDKEVREGVQYSRNPDQIILWELWEKTLGGYTVHTFSPQAPDRLVRQPFGCPYKVGGKPSIPYFSFKTEIKDKGWYSPRGVAELGAPFEQYACKLWNEKTDAMTLANRPVLTSEQAIPATNGIRWVPGEVIPGNIKGVPMSQPPFSFDQEIAFARATAEQQTGTPDFGILEPQKQPGAGMEEPTATKTRAVTQMASVSVESNGRMFRRDLAKVYRHTWGLMLQFKRKQVVYFVAGELKTLPAQALHDSYLIQPDGAPDQWNKELRQRRADGRLQKFANHPNVNQEELVHDSLEADDPLVAERLFIPGNVKTASEQEDEAVELLLLQQGYPAAVKPNEDHAARIYVLHTWLQRQQQLGIPIDPIAQQRVQQHLAVHFNYLRQTQPEAAKAVAAQITATEVQGAQPFAGATPGNGRF